jgi:hypothetical protein
MIYVTSAEYRKYFTIDVVFNDGSESVLDLKSLFESDGRTIVRELLDPVLFAQVSVENDTLVWPNGFDLAPEFLYKLARAAGRVSAKGDF